MPKGTKGVLGTHINEKGYVRFNMGVRTKYPYKGKYVHRWNMEQLIKEWNPFGWEGIPFGYHVHHMNFVKTHNCYCNLLLLDSALHDATSQKGRQCPITGRMLSRGELERRYGKQESEVPF